MKKSTLEAKAPKLKKSTSGPTQTTGQRSFKQTTVPKEARKPTGSKELAAVGLDIATIAGPEEELQHQSIEKLRQVQPSPAPPSLGTRASRITPAPSPNLARAPVLSCRRFRRRRGCVSGDRSQSLSGRLVFDLGGRSPPRIARSGPMAARPRPHHTFPTATSSSPASHTPPASRATLLTLFLGVACEARGRASLKGGVM